ncbi:hypothetical protein ACJ5NV_03520 [Loktanella agnita]|uniref:hypothetical protein n=1 Tax=Loktanella agnita TaxID=287097 RepID=UPI0039881DE7
MLSVFLAAPVFADEPIVENVTISGNSVSVTLSHPDTGWDHYADGWEVLDADGNSLGYRKLHHPHQFEQPFTRSLSGVTIPEGASAVFIRTSCNLHGWSDTLHEVALAR